MKRIHYAWLVCLGCALLIFCTSGLCINAFTVYQPYIVAENGFTNAQSSAIITVRTLFGFVGMLLTGGYYRRLSLRSGMTLAGLLTAAGIMIFAFAKTYAVYLAAAAATGLGYGLGSMIPIAIMLNHWFARKRTLALGICSASTGLSTLGIPSLLTWLIEERGLRPAFQAEAIAVAALIVLSFLLIRNTPADKGMEPLGADMGAEETKKNTCLGTLGKKNWIILTPAMLMLGALTMSGYGHLTMLSDTEGFSSQVTALAITVSGLALTAGKFIFGALADRWGTYRCNWLFGAVLIGGLALLCVSGSGTAMLMAGMCTYGAGLGLTTVGNTAWAGDMSTPEQYDRTIRRFQLYYTGGGMLFGSVPGLLADRFGGSYVPAYLIFTAFAVILLLTVQWTYRHLEKV